METVALPRIGTWAAWRDAARDLARRRVPPEAVLWQFGEAPQTDLFGGAATPPPPSDTPLTVPKSFLTLAECAVWHADPERFARLYAFLIRVTARPGLMSDRGDVDLARLRLMEKNVRRCAHKMKAFVRFRDLEAPGPRRRFAAWFEPTHHTVEPTAPFFTRRFADMDWAIVTPGVTATFENRTLVLGPGRPKPDFPEDAAEALWGTYFRNIFNPARVKIHAMTSEMPRKYWKNLPEARHIPELIATAQPRARAMAEAAPSLPPVFAEKLGQRRAPNSPVRVRPESLRALCGALESCTRCPLHGPATRAVPGEGSPDAPLMIVGEQPGDREDILGRPFVGPAGQLFDRVAGDAGLDRRAAWITNAVKHFKFRRDGKRRLHLPPNRIEIEHCKWWLTGEIELVKPRLILAMGATALHSLTGRRAGLLGRRGQIEESDHGPVFVTFHPSYLLRLRDPAERARATRAFRDDLATVAARVAG